MLSECREENRNEAVEMIVDLVSSVMWKLSRIEENKQEEYLIKLFKFLGKYDSIKEIWDKLIDYKAAIEKMKLWDKVEDEKNEVDEEESLNKLFE